MSNMAERQRPTRWAYRADRNAEEQADIQRIIRTDALLHRGDDGISTYPEHRGIVARLRGIWHRAEPEPGRGTTPDAAEVGDPWAKEREQRRRDGRG